VGTSSRVSLVCDAPLEGSITQNTLAANSARLLRCCQNLNGPYAHKTEAYIFQGFSSSCVSARMAALEKSHRGKDIHMKSTP